jgi:hypothetical protein
VARKKKPADPRAWQAQLDIQRRRIEKYFDDRDKHRGIVSAELLALLEPLREMLAAGDIRAGELALKVLERECRLHGLDKPKQVELTGRDGAPLIDVTKLTDAELERLVSREGGDRETPPGEDPGRTTH